jgi:signal transduction histidine kinase
MEQIRKRHDDLLNNPLLQTILRYAPVFVGVLTEERQFVLVNERFFSEIGYDKAMDGLGLRPGEILGCIHHRDVPEGCGEGPACPYCGVLQLLYGAISTGEAQRGESRLTTEGNGGIRAWDLLITVETAEVEGEKYFILFMQDIGAQKYKSMMEKIFFHDILNSATALTSLVNLLNPDSNEDDTDGFVGMLRARVNDLVEQIHFQRKLINAEQGEIVLNLESVELKGEISDLIAAEEQVVRLNGLGLDFHLEGEEVWVMGDRVVLRRVFLNMLKNAREASGPGDKVSVRIKEDGGRVKIGIHNPAVMPPAVRSQVFQRSFSTKGSGRGLGTYSIKLFTTNYMNGNITFRSEKGFGTEFILDIPVSPRDS